MGRVINTNSPTKIRNYQRRTIAEMLTQLGQKQTVDEEAKDMVATIVFALRTLYDVAEETASAWEKRDYWMKAERFLRQWEWTKGMAANLEDVLREEAWDLLPQLMMDLFAQFSDVQVKSMTRKPDEWQGAYARLMAAEPNTLLD
ncbi:MAG: hypothetical protein KDD89_10250 [Anaerolineales bacterium]|nr:hypothetical protein [Anaerolineales bacterium]